MPFCFACFRGAWLHLSFYQPFHTLHVLHPLYHFGGHPPDLLYPCQHLSCIGGLKLDTFLQMKSHSTNEGHGHFTKITQGQSFKCQGLNFRMPLLGSLNMAE